MEDLLLEDEISENEINAVLQRLGTIETAALLKRNDFREESDFCLSKNEMKLRNCLENFISIQPENQKNLILNSCDLMEDD